MSNLIPEPMSRLDLANILREIADEIQSGQSTEGNIEYMPVEGTPRHLHVRGVWRHGTGSLTMIGLVPGTERET